MPFCTRLTAAVSTLPVVPKQIPTTYAELIISVSGAYYLLGLGSSSRAVWNLPD